MSCVDYIKDPLAIEEKSMEIITKRLAGRLFGPCEEPVVKRVVHTTGDPSFADLLSFGSGAAAAGARVLARGGVIHCDVEMVRSGLNRAALAALRIEASCLIHEEEIIAEAKRLGTTRAAAAMARAVAASPMGGIFVIGNAPTALFVLLEAVAEGKAYPDLVVGTPVGFVGAAEAKEWLATFNFPWITVRGEKGGSTVASAIVNALLKIARELS